MFMVCGFQLVFYQDDSVVQRISRQNIGGEGIHRNFRAGEFQRNADGFGQVVNIVGKPRREVTIFAAPSLSKIYF